MTLPRAPAWRRDFPLEWVEDHSVTRRAFSRCLLWASGASFAATAGLAGQALVREAPPRPALPVARRGELPVGGSKAFDYPAPGEPCLLVRLDEQTFRAFAQRCTHLACPVVFEPGRNALHCPCHEGVFDAADGRVRSGPPPRPLPQVELEWRGEELWAVGIRG